MSVSDRPSIRTELFGVDIHSGDVRGAHPTYAMVRFDGEVIGRDTVSRRKLLRTIHDEEPAIVAVDNVFELAEDKDALEHFLAGLPSATSLVQVTGDQRPEPLSRVANRHDVPYESSPMGEAEAAARLAGRGVGYRVTAFEETSIVRVTRGRSPGKGGQSADRFTRRIHGTVKRHGRAVTRALEEAGLSFDRQVTEKYGGWSQAEFRVEAPPDALPVSAERAADVRVEVERISTGGIQFEPLVTRRDRVIVGVDPGTHAAVAVIDLEGTVVDVWSSRTSDMSEVVEWIIDHGRPLIVAADVHEMPRTVEQIRRSFDAIGWTPPTDVPVDEKLHRVRGMGVDNDHERDALAAALFAFDHYADRFERIQRRSPPTLEWGSVAALVLGEERSIESAIDQLTASPEPDHQPSHGRSERADSSHQRIAELEAGIEERDARIDGLERDVQARDDRIDELETRLRQVRAEERRSIRRERIVTRLEREKAALERKLEEAAAEIDALEGKVERMKTLWRLDHSNFADVEERKAGLVPVKPVEKFTLDAIERADADYGLAHDDVIFLRDASGAGAAAAERLVDLEPRVILKTGGLSDVAEATLWAGEVPVGSADDVAIQEVDELAVAREADVEAVIERWEATAAKRRLERKRALVDELIDEHRRGRAD